VPFHTYADAVIDRAGLEPVVLHGLRVHGTTRVDRAVLRDWAAIDGGAHVTHVTPPDYTPFGCGPGGAFDRSLLTGWGSDAPNSTVGSNVRAPRAVVVRLARAVHVTGFAIDPGPTCGDGPDAGVKAFDIYVKRVGGNWIRVVHRTTGLPEGRLSALPATNAPASVRFVKLVMRSTRGNHLFMDMSELSVRGR
jgi:hypothetical protein